MKSRPTPTPFDFMQRTNGSCYLKPHGRCKFLDALVSGHPLLISQGCWSRCGQCGWLDGVQSTGISFKVLWVPTALSVSSWMNSIWLLHTTQTRPGTCMLHQGTCMWFLGNCMQGPGTCMSHDLLREQRRGYNKYTTKRRWMFMVASPEMALGVRRRWSVEARMTSI